MRSVRLLPIFFMLACGSHRLVGTTEVDAGVDVGGTAEGPGIDASQGQDHGGAITTDGAVAPMPDLLPPPPLCPPGGKTGAVSGTASFSSPAGTSIIVRTPSGYDPQTPSPLIVVFAAANKTPSNMESNTALTTPATGRGYLVAYVDHITPGAAADVQEAADSVKAVTDKWCVDPKRVYLTGHSDGASMTHLVMLNELVEAAAVAPSASGLNVSNLSGVTCPARAVPIFEIHSSGDSLFPIAQGFGPDVAQWFATCAGCAASTGGLDASGCRVYSGCTMGAVKYCQGTASHGTWPTNRDTAVLDFFDAHHL